MKYVVVLERAEDNWAAFSPDVPGCVATGSTQEETMERYKEALRMHLDGLREDGLPLPEPKAQTQTVEV